MSSACIGIQISVYCNIIKDVKITYLKYAALNK